MSSIALTKGRLRKTGGTPNEKSIGERKESREKLDKSYVRPKYKRRTVEFHPDIDEVLTKLQTELKLRNQTDVLQKAVQILAILVGTDGKRRRIFLSDDDGIKELLIV